MRTGRKPLPANIRLIGGNAGHRPINEKEPKPEICVPPVPDHLSVGAKEHWDKYATRLAKMRVMTEADTEALSLLCEATAKYWHCNRMVREKGEIVPMGKNNYLARNPYLIEMNNSMKQMLSLLSEFGMTPSSRTRVQSQ